MKLEIIKRTLKLTAMLYRKGEIVFNKGITHSLGLKDYKFCKIARNSEDPEDESIYITFTNKEEDSCLKLSIRNLGSYTHVGVNFADEIIPENKTCVKLILTKIEDERYHNWYKLTKNERSN